MRPSRLPVAIGGIRADYSAVKAAFSLEWSNGPMRNTPPFRPRLTNCVNQANFDKLMSDLHEHGYRIVVLNGATVQDKLSFLRQAGTDLPQPAELIAKDNWDAFSDSLWCGLYEFPDTKVAIVWTHAQNMVNGNLEDFLVAVSSLADVGIEVANTEHGFPHPMSLVIFLVGEGVNFRG